ncbi:WYL domain-containing protein [Paenibacillus sp. FJAT-26967]|uniref:WYL domain-containing protein n=1 Tax=Paenibacillus sp. FJAT-26967 TaxID=1729690 RepID=UPI000A05BA44|nr:WYL domain-containing protein [Paenibacillus sp. FJAT-26967]
MNLFEKIFNYQIISRLDESGLYTLTSHERSWLKSMLAHPSAAAAFSPGTLEKLRNLLEPEQTADVSSSLTEKAKSREGEAFPPLLRQLRRLLRARQGFRLTYRVKNGRIQQDRSGLPYKLEYSMVKREWYLLWYSLHNRTFMSTRLQNITRVSEEPVTAEVYSSVIRRLEGALLSRKDQIVIEVICRYNAELSRILYAFSCFEKEVDYTTDTDTYRIRLTYQRDDAEYILSKLRFLGMRVKVVEGAELRERMRETSAKALRRYEIEPNTAELDKFTADGLAAEEAAASTAEEI